MSVIEYLEPSKQLKLWKKLRTESVIPVVDTETYKRRAEILSSLQQKIRRCDYSFEILNSLRYRAGI